MTTPSTPQTSITPDLKRIQELHAVEKAVGRISFKYTAIDDDHYAALRLLFQAHELLTKLCKRYPLPKE